MKRALHVGAAMVAAALVSAAAASAQVVVATATLGAGEETPILLSGAAGTAEVAIDTVAKEFAITLRIFNIPTTTTAGHIHAGPKGIAGPVVIDFPGISGRLGDFVTTFRVGEASFRPAAAGTTIDARGSRRAAGISAVTSIRGLALVSLEGKGMVGVPGIAARAFSAVAREKISVLMFSQASSEQNICLVVPEEDRARSFKALREEFGAEIALGKLDGVKAHGPVAAVAAVGEGMRGTHGIAARLFGAVAAARVNIEAIAQGSSEVNISFIVEDKDAAAAVAAVHRLCIARRPLCGTCPVFALCRWPYRQAFAAGRPPRVPRPRAARAARGARPRR